MAQTPEIYPSKPKLNASQFQPALQMLAKPLATPTPPDAKRSGQTEERMNRDSGCTVITQIPDLCKFNKNAEPFAHIVKVRPRALESDLARKGRKVEASPASR